MVQMFIGDEEVVCDKEFTITEEMLATSSTVLNNCYPKSWEANHDYVNNFYYPQDYSKFRLYNDDELIFCGMVKNTGNISLNPREPKYCSLQILDFRDFLSNGETLDFVIDNKTITETIEMIINTVSSYGFVVGNINILNGNDIIGAYSTENKTPYDVFQYLADISQSRWTTRMVDENTVAIDFYDPSLMPRADDIEYTQEYFEENNINDIKFSYGTYDYRNKQIILSDEVYASINYVENIYADGYNTTFLLTSNIGVMVGINVDGEDKTFITSVEKELGYSADFYYEPGKNELDSEEIYQQGSLITITYIPLIKGRQVVYNTNEVNRLTTQLGRKGVVSRYESRNDILSNSELEKIGQSYIKYKGIPEIKLTIQTHNKDLFNIGEVTYFDAPITELQADYMVKSKKTNIINVKNTQQVFYTYELTSSFNSESEINYFDNQRAKTTGNIELGEFIDRNIDIRETSDIIFDNLTVEEVEVNTTNVLNSTLNSVFNN